jgi:DNA-binding XRE family transcriptional regulator
MGHSSMSREKEICRMRVELKYSAQRIANQLGVSLPIVTMVLEENDLMHIKSVRASRPLSPQHAMIGEKLSYHRLLVEKDLEPAKAATKIGFSTHRLTAIERGVTEITLIDLAKIAKYCGTQIQNLFVSTGQRKPV